MQNLTHEQTQGRALLPGGRLLPNAHLLRIGGAFLTFITPECNRPCITPASGQFFQVFKNRKFHLKVHIQPFSLFTYTSSAFCAYIHSAS